MGMLSVTGMIVTVDSFGSIVDNAGGIVEMSGLGPKVREITDALDSVGNTTKAICKGFAIGSAGLAAMALFSAFRSAANLEVISITDTRFLIGLFIGGAIVFLFSAYCLEAVGIGAFQMVEEVRRQFREIPNLMEGGAKPDYARCVDISTRRALKSLMAPGLWAIITPIAIGFTLGAKAVAGLLAGSIVSAFVLALLMAHAGTAWDNAKKFIEAGHFGGKGTPTHAAAVVGDTIGDPFKDTAGPSLDILMKLMSIISVLFATLFIKYLLLPY